MDLDIFAGARIEIIMAALYIQMFEEMLQKHAAEFVPFAEIHQLYQQNQNDNAIKEKFDQIGKPALNIIERTQNDLCRKMENTNRGKYSSALSDKFMGLVRARFPLIDLVGVTIS